MPAQRCPGCRASYLSTDHFYAEAGEPLPGHLRAFCKRCGWEVVRHGRMD